MHSIASARIPAPAPAPAPCALSGSAMRTVRPVHAGRDRHERRPVVPVGPPRTGGAPESEPVVRASRLLGRTLAWADALESGVDGVGPVDVHAAALEAMDAEAVDDDCDQEHDADNH